MLKLIKIIKKYNIYIPKRILEKLGIIGGKQFETNSFKNKFLRYFWKLIGLYPNMFTYHFYYEKANSFMAPKMYEMTKMFEGIKFNKNETILDLGCGEGSLLFMLSKYVKKGVGVEILPHCVKDANLKAQELKGKMNTQFYCQKLEEIKFPVNTFDKVVSFSVIEHIPNYLEIFEETYNILKPGGQFIISVDSFSHFDEAQKKNHKKRFEVEKYFERQELHDLLKKLGYSKVIVEPIFNSEFSKKWFTRVMNNPGEYFAWHKRLYSFFLYFIIQWHEKRVEQENAQEIFLVARCTK
jgi:SAM-dependent methyltransferase